MRSAAGAAQRKESLVIQSNFRHTVSEDRTEKIESGALQRVTNDIALQTLVYSLYFSFKLCNISNDFLNSVMSFSINACPISWKKRWNDNHYFSTNSGESWP